MNDVDFYSFCRDTKENINKCLECTKIECDNCLIAETHYTRKHTKEEFNKIYALLDKGYSVYKIAKISDMNYGYCKKIIRKYKKEVLKIG